MWGKIIKDKEFTSSLTKIAVPVMLQSLITSSLNTLDTFMITKLGTNSIAGVGLANQVFFFYSFILFGINTGASIMLAQFFGANETDRVKKTLGYALKFSIAVSIVFNILAYFVPEYLISLFTDDLGVIAEGAKYMKVVSLSYIVTGMSFAIGIAMRSTGNARSPFIASFISFFVNAFFNYCFIFGKFGFPALGVKGAAVGTIFARFTECFVLIYVIRKYKGPLYANVEDLFSIDKDFRKYFVRVVAPVTVEETLWSLAQVVYGAIYAKIGVEATAAIQVAQAISNMLYVIARGVSSASAVILGIKIGENKLDRAHDMALKSLTVGFTAGVILGSVLIFIPHILLKVFPDLTPGVRESARLALMAFGATYPFRMYNSVSIVGVFRGGGDVKYSMLLELFCSWCVGIPFAAIGVVFFEVPLWGALLLSSTDEVVKLAIGTPRILKKKWIKRLA